MNNWINQDILFWTYSTIAQTFGAVLAFIGALSIFKMQIIHNAFRTLISRIRKEGGLAFPESLFNKTDNELYEYLKDFYINKRYDKKAKINGKYDLAFRLEILYKRLYDIKEHSIPNLKKKMIKFSILNISIIFLSLIGLASNTALSNANNTILLIVVIIFSLISLLFSTSIISHCLKV